MSLKEKAIVAAACVFLFLSVSQIRFRFKHPCLTETQLMMHTLDALAWRTLEGACK